MAIRKRWRFTRDFRRGNNHRWALSCEVPVGWEKLHQWKFPFSFGPCRKLGRFDSVEVTCCVQFWSVAIKKWIVYLNIFQWMMKCANCSTSDRIWKQYFILSFTHTLLKIWHSYKIITTLTEYMRVSWGHK